MKTFDLEQANEITKKIKYVQQFHQIFRDGTEVGSKITKSLFWFQNSRSDSMYFNWLDEQTKKELKESITAILDKRQKELKEQLESI